MFLYTFSKLFLPNFLSYADRQEQPCLNDPVVAEFPEWRLLWALAEARNMHYRTAIQANTETTRRTTIAAEYTTRQSYDVEAMYKTIVAEGNRRCGS